ncbi:helix-turn-helix protein [Haloactinopolyspora alba]|uniref:Helix-turn-helix protein n=1 Tax=Haloactinopolyspora alba TaxID=648780 RepID=A0A2P8E5J9_9ACTN|nr:XRE family transcriptional regulator [Haloactinopolyspora alba]PSL04749.1 helix-turn-helix protein [Haloactinopolyspora alba]
MTIGERVTEARTESGLTQSQLAATVSLDRSALAKIETDTRRVTAVELVAIARELGRRVEWFVDPGPQPIISYRQSKDRAATQQIDTELDRIVRDVEFVVDQTSGLISNPPEEARPPATLAEADALAMTTRGLLGLSPDEPAHNLSQLVTTIGLLPFAIHLTTGADAGTVLLDEGGVSVVNGDLHVGRRRLALAHELGHYLIADPYTTDWRVDAADSEALEARLDRFARAVLLPEADLRNRWAQWAAIADDSLRDTAIRAGSHYRVDMATLARRLAETGLVDAQEADDVRRARTKKADIVEKNLVVPHELEPVSLPRVYEQAVLRLYRRETVTSDRALGLLLGTFDQDGLPDLPAIPDPGAEIWAITS